MNIIRLTVIANLLFVFIIGCSGTYGNISKQTGSEYKVILAELRENSDDYIVYYGTRSGRRASALLFDPKNNGTKLVGDRWIKIEDQKTIKVWRDSI